jgi:hypothetical protein
MATKGQKHIFQRHVETERIAFNSKAHYPATGEYSVRWNVVISIRGANNYLN